MIPTGVGEGEEGERRGKGEGGRGRGEERERRGREGGGEGQIKDWLQTIITIIITECTHNILQVVTGISLKSQISHFNDFMKILLAKNDQQAGHSLRSIHSTQRQCIIRKHV